MTDLELALYDFRRAMLDKFKAVAGKHVNTVTIDGNLDKMDPAKIREHLEEEIKERLESKTSENAMEEDVDVANLLFLDWYQNRKAEIIHG
jgi:hypothetical protein